MRRACNGSPTVRESVGHAQQWEVRYDGDCDDDDRKCPSFGQAGATRDPVGWRAQKYREQDAGEREQHDVDQIPEEQDGDNDRDAKRNQR